MLTKSLSRYAAQSAASMRVPGRQARHLHAALCLYGQPFGFTWEDVDGLRALAESLGGTIHNPESVAPLRDLADRIAAMLPPR
ncbi:MAG: hypothetical protein EXR72_23365 [Myxococcales bacterium]|nr:hypothetical protein [Myxococcales bacterium]